MKNLLLGGLCAAISVGCGVTRGGRASQDLTTTHIEFIKGTNRVVIAQPKDTKWDELRLTDDGLVVLGYVSAANAGALELEKIRAQAAHDTFTQGILLGREAASTYMRMQGIPVPAPAPAPAPEPVTIVRPAPAAPAPIPNAGRIFDPTPGVTVTNQPGRATSQP